MSNPLLDMEDRGRTPRFGAIEPEHVVPAVRQRIEEAQALLGQLSTSEAEPTWEGWIEPLDEVFENLERAWGPVEHLRSVLGSEGIREAHREAQPLVDEFLTSWQQDPRVREACQKVLDNAEAAGLTSVQRRALEEALRDFRLAGAELPEDKQTRFREIQVELGRLSSLFSDHVVDATQAYRLEVTDASKLEGLPQRLIDQARAKAKELDPDGPEECWVFTLHMPSYRPFLQYQRDRDLREAMYRAFVTRASEGELDNSPVIAQLLALRQEQAELLGFANYAEVSLATKMAESPAQVEGFLRELVTKSRPFGERDKDELEAYAKQRDGLESLEAWDVLYYREALRQERYAFSDDEVRQYFPLDQVLTGLFEILNRLYGIKLEERTPEEAGVEPWHPSVKVLEVTGPDGELRGHMLLDLFARDGKRQGAWMNTCVDRRRIGDRVQRPVAYLVCNFGEPVDGKPALLGHEEVRTVFHECGHCLHHVLTQVDVRQCAGISRVPWDGVELPSQFQENWVWQQEGLALLTRHVETGEPLPQELLEKMLAAKNFMSGADMLRQLEFSLFDLVLHSSYDPSKDGTANDLLMKLRKEVSVFSVPENYRFENAFGHIFAGGYAAGYYSYKWAEVLAADAFSRFEEEGVFSAKAGGDFRAQILEKGGSEDLMALYVSFRGREPTPDALLRHSGLVGAAG